MLNLNEYKNKLEIELEKITEELKTLGVHNPETDDWIENVGETNLTEADSNVEADMAEDMEERGSTLSALEIEYRNIKRALTKLEAGTFGICEISGEPIEEDRLNFKPTARTCKTHMEEEGQLPL
ncbi:MAG: TraR/DksA C4-type zinc finger protein [Candidatus Pacebacteria bacterium]|nr:TraR/DksA C4-type zinc finger protein [Candidatus Paceibacterota bacterium]